jgi:hypothetical protein
MNANDYSLPMPDRGGSGPPSNRTPPIFQEGRFIGYNLHLPVLVCWCCGFMVSACGPSIALKLRWSQVDNLREVMSLWASSPISDLNISG